jgi:penicillin amidase
MRKNVYKWFMWIAVGLLAVAVGLAGAVAWLVRRPWPQISGTARIPGLEAPVEIVRDQWGVPHIYAQNEHDLFLAQGYVHAQDRLWQMELNRRFVSGTLSEVLGAITIDLDRTHRTLGLRRAARYGMADLDADTRAILAAYAEGINAFIEMHHDYLPLEFAALGTTPEHWSPVDTLAMANLMAYRTSPHYAEEGEASRLLALAGEEAIRQLLPPRDETTPLVIPPETTGHLWLPHNADAGLTPFRTGSTGLSWGSNAWVIHGSRTATGTPLLANDTHLDLGMPSAWYENGLHGGRFDCIGLSLAGVPLIISGHNEHIAWGIATLRADDQDAYAEIITNDNLYYRFDGEWLELQTVQESINVRGDALPLIEEIHITHHGPVTGVGADGRSQAIRWTLYEGNTTVQAVVHLALATNWDEFRTALEYWVAPGQSFVYADTEGNVGYQAAGKVPIRAKEHDGRLPVPGWTGEYEWQGYIPFEEMPSSYNPPQGLIVAANNKIVSDDYAYLISASWSPGYRARRIADLFSTNDRLSTEDVQRAQADTYSVHAETLLPYLLTVDPGDWLQARALAHLEAWDLYYDADSVGASLFEVWYAFMVQNTVFDELGEAPPAEWLLFTRPLWLANIIDDAGNAWFDDVSTPATETRDDIVRRSLADAVDWLRSEHGLCTRKWKWGSVHTVTLVHWPLGQIGIPPIEQIFNSSTLQAPGALRSVNSAGHYWNTSQLDVVYGTSQRMIIDVGDWDAMLAVNSTGQVEHVLHPNREDQIRLWLNAQYRAAPFSREAVEEGARAVLVLAPQE